MGRASREDPPRRVEGLKYLQSLWPLLERLQAAGCERDRAGNRELFFPQYVSLILLTFFNPALKSVRALQQASELEQVQRKLRCKRVSLGSLSEAGRVFDPKLLEPIIAELAERIPATPGEAALAGLSAVPTAVDGTLLKALPQITQACYATRRDQGWKLHTHFELLRGIPTRMTLTDASGAGAANEKRVLRQALAADRCYVMDRGYEEFALFNAIVAAKSSYVCRVKASHHFTVETARELTAEARAAGVVEDAVGRPGSPNSKRAEPIDHLVRRIVVRAQPHPKRGKTKRPAVAYDLVIVTNLLDVPAEIIAALYRYRWWIELFFRFFKHVLGCQHLLSEHPGAIQIQAYCALIACLLICLIAGRKPGRRTFEMLCLYFQGWASEDELLRHLEKLPLQKPAA